MKSLVFAIVRTLFSSALLSAVRTSAELRCITRAIVILTVGVWLLKADGLPPSLVWTGDAIITWYDYGISYPGQDLPDGLSSSAGCGDQLFSCIGTFTDSRTFTVVSPGVFSLTTEASSDDSYFDGAAGLTYGEAFVTANFDDSDSIIGPTSFSQGVSDSGSNSQDCSQAPFDVCSAEVNLSDSANNFVFLPIGNYTLEQSFSLSVYGSGDPFSDYLFVTTTLVPTPEPRFPVALLICGFIGLLWFKKKSAGGIGCALAGERNEGARKDRSQYLVER